MSTNEFDRLIAKNVSRVSYEYDANDWENLSIQLAAARRKKRAIVFAYFSSGIAASLAILLISTIAMRSNKELPATQYAATPHTAAPFTPSVNSNANIPSAAAPHTSHYKAPAVIFHKGQAHPILNAGTYNAPIVAHNNPPQNTITPPAKKQIDTPGFEQKMRQHGYEEPMLSYTKTENRSGHKHINLSVAAGFNYGTINTGYAIGAAIDKKLGNKFGVEVMVAYVGNTASASGSQYPSPPPPYGPPGKPSPVPAAASSSPLNYLQFAPMADYSLSKKLTLSAGADLQRLLQDHDVTVMYDNDLKVAPPIDLGMLLRTEYAIFPFLKAGLSYRLGANNIVAPGNNYFDRNYMQIQLKYKLH